MRLFVRRVPPGCVGNEIAFYAAPEGQPTGYLASFPVQFEPIIIDSVLVPAVAVSVKAVVA